MPPIWSQCAPLVTVSPARKSTPVLDASFRGESRAGSAAFQLRRSRIALTQQSPVPYHRLFLAILDEFYQWMQIPRMRLMPRRYRHDEFILPSFYIREAARRHRRELYAESALPSAPTRAST